MLKRFFQFSLHGDAESPNGSHRNGSAGHSATNGAAARAKEDGFDFEPAAGPALKVDGPGAAEPMLCDCFRKKRRECRPSDAQSEPVYRFLVFI